MSYSKLFSSIIHSTVWRAGKDVQVLWTTLMAMCDRDGVVESSLPGLADAAQLSLKETEAALKVLMSPDPYSRTPDHEGRRVAPVDGGWVLLNYEKYREKDDLEERRRKDRERQQRRRERLKAKSHATSRDVTKNPKNPLSAATASASASAAATSTTTSGASKKHYTERAYKAPWKATLDCYYEEYQHQEWNPEGVVPAVSWNGRDKSAAQALAKGRTKEECWKLVKAFLTLDDQYLLEQGYPFALINSKLNKILVGRKAPPRSSSSREVRLPSKGPAE